MSNINVVMSLSNKTMVSSHNEQDIGYIELVQIFTQLNKVRRKHVIDFARCPAHSFGNEQTAEALASPALRVDSISL